MRFLIIFFLMINNLFATEFYTTQTFRPFTEKHYVTPKYFDIKIMSIQEELFDEMVQVEVVVNKTTHFLVAKLVNEFSDGISNILFFETTIKEDVLADGFSCSENEVISYTLKFNLIKDQDIMSPNYRSEALSITAFHTYSWDLCHDFNPEFNTIEYNKN